MVTSAFNEEQKAMLEEMARTWDTLAVDRERQLIQKQRISELKRPGEER